MLTHTGCLKTRPAQKQLLQVFYEYNLYSYKIRITVNGCLEYMQTFVYYNPHMGTWTHAVSI